MVNQRLDDELKGFAFWPRYPSRGRGTLGEATIGSYLYTARRFLQFLDGKSIDQDTAERFIWAL